MGQKNAPSPGGALFTSSGHLSNSAVDTYLLLNALYSRMDESKQGKIKEIFSNDTGQAILDYWINGSDRPFKKTDIKRVSKYVKVYSKKILDDSEVLSLFKQLEKIGMGKVDEKSLPKHSVFKWSYDIKEVLALFKGSKTKATKTKPASSPNVPITDTATVPFACRLPSGKFLVFPVPIHITREEGEAVVSQLKDYYSAVLAG